jgi:hypothetical protein
LGSFRQWRFDSQIADPALRAMLKAEIETLIADIEAGRRRIGDRQ